MFVKACVLLGYALYNFESKNGLIFQVDYDLIFKYLVFWFEKFNVFVITKLFSAWDIYLLSIFVLILLYFYKIFQISGLDSGWPKLSEFK